MEASIAEKPVAGGEDVVIVDNPEEVTIVNNPSNGGLVIVNNPEEVVIVNNPEQVTIVTNLPDGDEVVPPLPPPSSQPLIPAPSKNDEPLAAAEDTITTDPLVDDPHLDHNQIDSTETTTTDIDTSPGTESTDTEPVTTDEKPDTNGDTAAMEDDHTTPSTDHNPDQISKGSGGKTHAL
ncbi:hypothetical protein E3N88_45628 [Mikania micrantha]|uniref:Uncharacterized protein n=1 Tax=Mikania micrantha TaxID=192012 RepID=A0A5N6L8W7_9ASTR|nr:hypothetical protein E3N88_45628 [Mikania micrantha]